MKNQKHTIKSLVDAHPVVKMPKKIRRRKNIILTTEITTTAIIDLLSFSVKGCQMAILAGHNFIALLMFLGYFLRSVLSASVRAFTDSQKQLFNSQFDTYITKNVSDIANIVRGKVFQCKNNVFKIIGNAEIIVILKDYITYIWTFFQQLPVAVANIISAILMLVSIFLIELKQSSNSLTMFFMVILIFCIVIFIILYKQRIKIYKQYKPHLKELSKEKEVFFNDIKNIEPLIKKEFSYRAQLLIDVMVQNRVTEKEQIHKLNTIQIIKHIVISIFMILIICVKMYAVGGINNINLALITDILAISSIYSAILDKISAILSSLEKLKNTKLDAETLKSDFDSVIKVLEEEEKSIFTSESINQIEVRTFEFSYPNPISAYKLVNKTPFVLEKGKSYLVYGHTGCGKSTFMHLLTGKIKLNTSPIFYGNESNQAYLSSMMQESNGRLGINPILDELIFNSISTENLNKPKLIEILKGTHIYFDIMRNLSLKTEDDGKILNYLKSTTIEQYSSGQKQRLAIVKVLYNLNSNHQIVVFDEATNALDDNTAISVLKFMSDYCQKDIKRIVFFVSHQVEITQKICDGKITFIENEFSSYTVTAKV